MELYFASVDAPDVNLKFKTERHYNFTILSDPDKHLADELGVLSSFGYAKRWTYIIDDKGVIRAILDSVDPKTAGPDLVKALDAAHAPLK